MNSPQIKIGDIVREKGIPYSRYYVAATTAKNAFIIPLQDDGTRPKNGANKAQCYPFENIELVRKWGEAQGANNS